MKRSILLIFGVTAMLLLCSSCVSTHMSITGSTPQLNIELKDLEVTEPVEATAVSVKLFGVDWGRLLSRNEADVRGSVYTSLLSLDRTENYAVYDLLKKNKGYDIVLYPQFYKVTRKPFLGLGLIYKVTEVKVSARMAKLRSNNE